MKFKTIIILLLCAGAALAQKKGQLSLSGPPSQPMLLAPGFISTSMNERDFALSPDGKEIFYTISSPKSIFQTIVFIRQTAPGQWTTPEVASFAGTYSDIEPVFSADGNTLFFASNRPVTGDKVKDFDIWKVRRTPQGWEAPENLGTVINTEADEFYPSVARNGNLYFTAAYKGGPGREDIYKATWHGNEYQNAIALDTAVNSKFYEFNAFVDPNEQYILFTSYGRKDDAGGGDLYIALKDANGQWKSARNLTDLNSKQLDYCPFVSPDGKILFFTSERHQLPTSFSTSRATRQSILELYENPKNGIGNIYWMNFESLVNSLKP
jgi:Tol biopolymer transport system component